jgi:hypothetical protein
VSAAINSPTVVCGFFILIILVVIGVPFSLCRHLKAMCVPVIIGQIYVQSIQSRHFCKESSAILSKTSLRHLVETEHRPKLVVFFLHRIMRAA